MRPRSVLALTVLCGCGAASDLAPRAAAVEPAAPPARCELEGVAPEVPLTVEGLSDVIELASAPGRFLLTAGTADVLVRASRPLELTARTEAAALPVHLGARLRAYGVIAEAGVRATDLVPGADGVAVTLHADPRLHVRLVVGCNALDVGEVASPARWTAHDGTPTHRLVGEAPVALSSGATSTPFAALLGGEGLQVTVLEARGARARVRRRLDYGHLEGWVDLARLAPEPPGTGWDGFGSSCCGGVRGIIGRGRAGPLVYEGAAILRRGALVRGDGDVVWARATEDVRVWVGVRPEPTAPVMIFEVAGVTSHRSSSLPGGITVTRDDLVFPPGTTL